MLYEDPVCYMFPKPAAKNFGHSCLSTTAESRLHTPRLTFRHYVIAMIDLLLWPQAILSLVAVLLLLALQVGNRNERFSTLQQKVSPTQFNKYGKKSAFFDKQLNTEAY